MNRDMRRHRKEWDWAEELLYEDSDFIPQGSNEKPGEWDIDKDIREIREDLSKYYFSREYATRQEKKRLVDQEFDKMGELMKRFSFADDAQEIPISKKRKTALLHLIDRIETEISTDNGVRESLGGLLSLPETLCNFELLPVRMPYDTLDYYENITLAAALWILDDLKRSRKLYEAYSFLPADYSEIYETDIPTNFYDTCYDEDLIRSVMCVIIDRNRRRDKDEKVSKEQKIYCDVADAQEQKPQSVYRSRFDGLFSLIDQNRAEKAAEHFREKQMAVIKKYLSCMAIFDRRDTDLVRPVLQTASLLVVKQTEPDEEEMFRIMRGIEDNQEDRADFEQGFVEYLGKSFREIKRETGNKEISKSLSDFMVDDPYETCFALLYLLEKGDDAPWLYRSGNCVVDSAVRMLPWHNSPFEANYEELEEDEPWEDFDLTFNEKNWIERQEAEGVSEKTDYYHARYNDRNLAQIIFGMSGGILPRNFHPFEYKRSELSDEGFDEKLIDEVIGLSEMLFLSQFRSDAPNLNRSGWGFEGTIEQEKESKGAESDKSGDGNPDGGIQSEQEAIIRSYKDEVKNLKKVLSELTKQAQKEKAGYERELKALRQEHRELADLREIIFNQDEKESRPSAEPSEDAVFPYEMRKRTVLFGGHETFLKAFRPKFKNLRIVDTGLSAFNPELVRNADVVWIQNNCISHSQYYAIVNAARKYGIQVRYFPYSSADKCAKLLVREDRKG